jgi:Cdc6-like AAA superfamily ATPase
MTSQGGQASARWGKNPFPVSAVARFSPLNGESFSIQTPAMAQALAYVDQYLAEESSESGRADKRRKRPVNGNVIAVVGEYGTGKTHLSIELLRRIQSHDDDALHVFYVDAPADNFLALYRDRFFGQLDRRDVFQRVAEYYADVVAEELGESPLTENVARLLADRQASPHEIVQRFGLRESTFQQRLQERLRSITEHEEFGTALGLFMRPEFEAAVWEWLAGHPADPVLQERGIHRTIDDDISALEAIGVFAFLYGRQRHRFVLIVDEFEKVMSRETRSATDGSAVLAFKKMLEVFSQSRSLLVLSGLPDFMEVLPDDARQRIASIVRPTALSFDDACQYVHNALGRGSEDLAPFSDDSISYLVELAGGNARKVIRLCYHAYEASARSGADVTRAMVREVARQQFEVSTPDDVLSDVARILDSNGLIFERSKRMSKKPSFIADYWLPVGGEDAGCAIKITQSVLHAPEAERLAQAAGAFQKGRGNVATVLIVNGYLAEPLANQVNASFSRVMTYSPMRFSEDFSAAISSLVNRLESASNEDRLGLVESKLDQLLRQTQSVRRAVDVVQQDSISPDSVELAVEGGIRRAFGQVAGRPDPVASSWRLSAATAEIFRKALNEASSLEDSTQADLRQIFLRSKHLSTRKSVTASLPRTLAAGALVSIIEGFRDAVVASTRNARAEAGDRDHALSDACMMYDRYFDELISTVGMNHEPSPVIDTSAHGESFWTRLEGLKSLAMEVWQAERRQDLLD